jgi:hypothetical protein
LLISVLKSHQSTLLNLSIFQIEADFFKYYWLTT